MADSMHGAKMLRVMMLERAAHSHAKRCGRCFVPIVDDEGNPGYLSEACKKGYPILDGYINALKSVGAA